MFKTFSTSLIILFLISNFLFAQEANTIQINGGIIMPMNSSKGLTTSLQFNYSLSSKFQVYLYGGYSAWDKYNTHYLENLSTIQHKQHFTSYSADEHILIPIFFGAKINLHTNKIFTSFLNFELGYSYLSFNSYQQSKVINPETGEVLSYHPDIFSKIENEENLFGFGIGAGISHPMGRKLNLILAFKLNGYLNSNYYNFFNGSSVNTTILAGFGFNI
jgi:hypothetical protein